MATGLVRSIILGGVFSLFAASAVHAVDVGEAAPQFDLAGAGQTVRLPAAGGKVTYVDFWASWCGTCRQSFPWMNEIQRKYAAQGLEVIGVNLDAEATDAEKFLAKVPAEFTVAYDPVGDSARRFGVKGMPTSLLLGRDGTVLLRHTGFSASDSAELEAAIRRAVATPQ
jgi:thiol-disulfide isomerase/thioredoxin